MLGKTAGGLFWMFRSLERAENTARLIEAGFRIALTRSNNAQAEWRSVITTLAAQQAYESWYSVYDSTQVVNFLLREEGNPSSVRNLIKTARDNARLVRTGLTTEVWSAVNETWMVLTDLLKEPVPQTELPAALATIRQQSALVRGALYGTMLRNDLYDFCRLGTFIERMDNTARIIDVKNHALLPAQAAVGGRLDNTQWETLLRSVSAHRSYRWVMDEDFTGPSIAEFLILDMRMPRSLSFCASQIAQSLQHLEKDYGEREAAQDAADALLSQIRDRDISSIFDQGLHSYVNDVIRDTAALATQIEIDYRFTG